MEVAEKDERAEEPSPHGVSAIITAATECCAYHRHSLFVNHILQGSLNNAFSLLVIVPPKEAGMLAIGVMTSFNAPG